MISGRLRTELPLEELDVTNPRRKCFNLESQRGAGVQRGDFMGRMIRMVNGNLKNFMKDS